MKIVVVSITSRRRFDSGPRNTVVTPGTSTGPRQGQYSTARHHVSKSRPKGRLLRYYASAMSICFLCLKDKDLISNSHIIPDFMYQDLYDDKHRMIRTVGLNVKTARKIQTGEKEGELLCAKCDNEILGSLEGYASRVLFTGEESIRVQNVLHPDGQLTSTLCEDLDYGKFKLFLLSLLWRASISRNAFFSQVQLGPLEESVRRMIIENDSQGQMDFPCLVSSWRYDQRRMASAVISSPRRIQGENGGTRYIFQIGQFLLMFFVSKNDRPDWLRDAAITPENRMRIIHLNPEHGQGLLEALFDPIFVQALSSSASNK